MPMVGVYLCNALVAKQTTTTTAAAVVVVYCSRPYSITVMSRGRERERERKKESYHGMTWSIQYTKALQLFRVKFQAPFTSSSAHTPTLTSIG